MERPAITLYWKCPNCHQETKVYVSEYYPAQISGPPESCYEAEGGEIEPELCKHCGDRIDLDKIADMVDDAYYNFVGD